MNALIFPQTSGITPRGHFSTDLQDCLDLSTSKPVEPAVNEDKRDKTRPQQAELDESGLLDN